MAEPRDSETEEPGTEATRSTFARAGIDNFGLDREQVVDFQRRMGIPADGIMGPQTRALWEKQAISGGMSASGAPTTATRTRPARKKAAPQVRRISFRIARIGMVDVWETPPAIPTSLDFFDGIVVPVDKAGQTGQFVAGLAEIDPALGQRIATALADRRRKGVSLRKADLLEVEGPPILIAAIGNVGESRKSAIADLTSASSDAIGIAIRQGVSRLLFPLLSVGSGGGSAETAAAALFASVLQMPQSSSPADILELHVCTRDKDAMDFFSTMVRDEAARREANQAGPALDPTGGEEVVQFNPAQSPPANPALRFATPGYRTDSVTEEPRDFVGVGAEILAFARLAASREIEPPLAVGVFGDWGSGKSFFMNGVRRKIEKLGLAEEMRIAKAKEAGETDPESSVHINVVQIEFNAWHYIEKNLWASLVEYIFSRLEEWLRAHNEGAADNGAALFESLATSRQLKLDTARSVMSANAELIAARKAAAQAEQDKADTLKSKVAALDAFFRVTVEEVAKGDDFAKIKDRLAVLGLTKANASAEEVQKAVVELQQTGDRGKLIWQAARTQMASPYAWLAVLSLLLVPIVVPPLVNGGLGLIDGNARLPAELIGASAALTTAAGWIKNFLGKVKPALDQAERFSAKVQEKMVTLQAAATSEAEKTLIAAQAAAAEAEKQLAAAQERLRLAAAQAADAQNRYTAESARGRLNRFIRERLADGTYGKHLGLIATIRKDFEQLTALVAPSPANQAEQARNMEEEKAYELRVKALIEEAHSMAGEDLLGAEAQAMLENAQTIQAPPRVFERIVLYIDDLDRCPPDRVVEVLQAVHMLLSFRLFVVFVAVDARWVTCALREVYEHQLDKGHKPDEDDPTPGIARSPAASMATAEDYMEKIFQIPYWVRPLQGEEAGGFMRKLVQSFGVDTQPADMPETPQGETASASSGGAPQAPNGEEAVQFDTGNRDAGASAPTDAAVEDEEEDEEAIVAFAKAAKLKLVPEDLEALAAMAPVVGDSPRRIKRFFNTYLLIQSIASVSVNEDSPDIDAESRAQVAQMIDRCSFAQQTLALATSLALAMQDKARWIDATDLANLDEVQVNGGAINGRALPPEAVRVLSAYLKARKPDEQYPQGCHAAFGLFLPIARRYGFHDAGDVVR